MSLPSLQEGLIQLTRSLWMFAGPPTGHVVCRTCDSSHTITRVALPFVLKYLVTELAAMNIKCTFDLKPS